MFKYLEHTADMIIYAEAESWPEVFTDGAKAVFNLMYEIQPQARNSNSKTINVKAVADSIEGLFIEWLNELLAQKDINNLIFIDFSIKNIRKQKGRLALVGLAKGIDMAKYQGELKTEVKAATYGSLKCGRKKKKYFCQCIVDL